MEYSKFRFKAQVDWIEIQVTTGRASNMKFVRDTLERIDRNRKYYVTGDLNSGSVFSFRIQDPHSFAEIESITNRLSRDLPIDDRSVLGIEIAFDAYARKGTTHNDLAELVATTYTFNSHHTADNIRLYREFAQAVPARRRDLVARLADGWNLACGDQGDHNARAQRWYLKTVDNNKQPLPVIEHRARYEVTLRGAHCPVTSFADLAAFDFSSVGNLFSFRKLRDDLPPVVSLALSQRDAVGMYAPRSRQRAAGRGMRLMSPMTAADTTLNLIAKRSLVALSRRWAEKQFPQNSTFSEGANPANTRDAALSPINYQSPLSVVVPLSGLPLPVVGDVVVTSLPGVVVSTVPSEHREPGSLDTDIADVLALLDALGSDTPASGPETAQQDLTRCRVVVPVSFVPDVRFNVIESKPSNFSELQKSWEREMLSEIEEIISERESEEDKVLIEALLSDLRMNFEEIDSPHEKEMKMKTLNLDTLTPSKTTRTDKELGAELYNAADALKIAVKPFTDAPQGHIPVVFDFE